MNNVDALKQIMLPITDELVIASCGNTSRALYSVRDRTKNFYNLFGMGYTLGIAIGVALNTKQKVVAIIGDGEALMSLGTLVLFKKLNLPNLNLFILDNHQYESTGGQPTCSSSINFEVLCPCVVYQINLASNLLQRIPFTPKQITERFMNAINSM
jgi:thiamine pyrophosphate-dependent acetolactate synthase large subunit-like protein